MVYFYALTFVVALIVYEINYFVIALHVISTLLLVILGFKNPGIVLKITEDFDNPSKIELPFDTYELIKDDGKNLIVKQLNYPKQSEEKVDKQEFIANRLRSRRNEPI